MRKFIVYLCFLLLPVSLWPQNSTGFYPFKEVPQSNQVNPAFQPDCDYYVGIPALSSIHLGIGSSGFSYHQLFAPDRYDLQYLVDHAHNSDYLNAEAYVQLLSAGMRYKNMYFSLSLANRLNAFAGYPKALLEIPWYGNAAFVGKTADLSRLMIQVDDRHELVLGLSYKLDESLTVGANAKLLFGLANTSTRHNSMQLTTDDEFYALLFSSSFRQNSSFPFNFGIDPVSGFVNDISLGEIDYLGMLLNFNNLGVGLDLGFDYKFSPELNFSASIVDLGFIRYKTQVSNLSQEGEVSYSGYTGTNLNTYFDALIDDFMTNHGIALTNEAYVFFLPTQLYLNSEYRYSKNLSLGLTTRSQFLPKKLKNAASIYGIYRPFSNFSFSLAYSVINYSYTNVSVGMAVKLGGIQMHLATNNLPGLIYPYTARELNFRMGLTYMFGCDDHRAKASKKSNGRGCYWMRSAAY